MNWTELVFQIHISVVYFHNTSCTTKSDKLLQKDAGYYDISFECTNTRVSCNKRERHLAKKSWLARESAAQQFTFYQMLPEVGVFQVGELVGALSLVPKN